ncbi:MAG TPA: class IV adenylate cyclase [Chitinophagaceae bacterium]
MPLNFEFKAKTSQPEQLESLVKSMHGLYKGEDKQTDTYFNVHHGRLKLREGNIENALIHYHRENSKGAKKSEVLLYEHVPDKNLKDILIASLGIKVVVDKRRKIYFIENVKFHFDEVDKLGSFVEVEAIDRDGSIGLDKLAQQCNQYKELFEIQEEDIIAESYSDMVLNQNVNT